MKFLKSKTGLFLLFSVLLLPFFVFAQDFRGGNTPPDFSGGNTPPNFSGGNTERVTLENPLGNITSFEGLIRAVLDAAFVIGLPIAVFFIVLAGLRFVLARGNQEKLTKAKTNLLYTVIGIAIFFGAWLLAEIIETTVTSLRSGL